MPANAFVKVAASGTSAWKTVKSIFVKKSTSSWVSVQDAWVKVSPTSWIKFFSSPTAPDSPIEISTSFDTSQQLRLQGYNYKWTPAPDTLQYKFSVVNKSDSTQSKDITSFTTTSNPTSSTVATILPTLNTYQTVTRTSGNYYPGVVNVFRFTVRATRSGVNVDATAEYEFRIPAAPTLSITSSTSTSATLSITAASTDDYIATGRYIVYRNDTTAGTVYGTSGGTNGLGGIPANTSTVNTTITGLVPGRQYTFSVVPVTGTNGYDLTTYTGYAGPQKDITFTTESVYTFAFGDNLYVSTNGYIGINGATSAQGSDLLPTTGEYLAVVSKDLQQSSNTSIWYWSDTSKYIVRWEGYDYGNTAGTKTYQITFYSGQSYADVYAILVNGTAGSTTAHYKNGVTKSSYTAALTTGAMRRVYFDGTATATITGLTEQNKNGMKQVAGLTSGSTDVGYTTLTTATNQVNFTEGTIPITGGSTAVGGVGKVTDGALLTITPTGFSAGTTYTYAWKKSNISATLTNGSVSSTQTVSTIGASYFCQVTYTNSAAGVSKTLTSDTFLVVPTKPTYTLTDLANATGQFTITPTATSGVGFYFGTWKLGTTGTETTISRTAITTNSTITSGDGTAYVKLFSSANVTYLGDLLPTAIDSWEFTEANVTVTKVSLGAFTFNVTDGSTVPSTPSLTFTRDPVANRMMWEWASSVPSDTTKYINYRYGTSFNPTSGGPGNNLANASPSGEITTVNNYILGSTSTYDDYWYFTYDGSYNGFVRAFGPSSPKATVSWGSSTNAKSYKVAYTISGASAGNGSYSSTTTGTSLDITPASGGTVTVNNVIAYVNADATGSSLNASLELNKSSSVKPAQKTVDSNNVSVTVKIVPGVPTLGLTAGNTKVTLTFTKSTTGTTDGYFYSYSTTNTEPSSWYNTTNTSIDVTGLVNGTTYYFWARAHNTSTTVYSAAATGNAKPVAASFVAASTPTNPINTYVDYSGGKYNYTASWTASSTGTTPISYFIQIWGSNTFQSGTGSGGTYWGMFPVLSTGVYTGTDGGGYTTTSTTYSSSYSYNYFQVYAVNKNSSTGNYSASSNSGSSVWK